jgi:hypothetical protein
VHNLFKNSLLTHTHRHTPSPPVNLLNVRIRDSVFITGIALQKQNSYYRRHKVFCKPPFLLIYHNAWTFIDIQKIIPCGQVRIIQFVKTNYLFLYLCRVSFSVTHKQFPRRKALKAILSHVIHQFLVDCRFPNIDFEYVSNFAFQNSCCCSRMFYFSFGMFEPRSPSTLRALLNEEY